VLDAAFDASGGTAALIGSGDPLLCLSATFSYSDMSIGSLSMGLTRFAVRLVGSDGVAGAEAVLCDACDPLAVGPMALARDAAGNIYVAGSFAGTLTLGGDVLTAAGLEDVLVAKLDPAGAPVWARGFGAAMATGVATDIVADGAGGVVLAGRYGPSIAFEQTLTAGGAQDIFVARLDDAGAPTWSKGFPNAWANATPRLAATPDGVVMTGDFVDTVNFGGDPLVNPSVDTFESDAYLVKLAPDGTHAWSKQLGDGQVPILDAQGGTSLAVDAGGNIVVVGAFGGTVDFGGGFLGSNGYRDTFIARFSPAGDYLESTQIHSNDGAIQGDHAIAVDAAGRMVVAGAFWAEIDYGGMEPLQSKAENNLYDDIFLVRFPAP
jgi:hypothetical protein